MKKILLRFIILLLLFTAFLSACNNKHDTKKEPQNTGKYKPIENPNPQYYMTATGSIDPTITNSTHLVWIVKYAAANPSCNVITNKIEGVKSDRTEIYHLETKVNNTGFYKLKIPLDKFKPGYCNWRIKSIDFSLPSNMGNKKSIYDNQNTLVFFTESNIKTSTLNSHITLLQHNKTPVIYTTDSTSFIPFNKRGKLNFNNNYSITLNIKQYKDEP